MRQTAAGIWQIASDRRHDVSGQKFAQLRVAVADKKSAQILAGFALGEVSAQQSLERIRNFGRGAAISDGPRA